MIFLPECVDFIGGSMEETLNLAESLDGDNVTHFSQLAKQHGVWLSLGGVHEKV